MDDASGLLLRLADPAARGGLLDAAALLAIATVGYDIDPASVVGDTTAVYDRFDVAVPVQPEVVAAARASRALDPVPWELTASVDGVVGPSPGADAVWAGSLALRVASGVGTITSLTLDQPDLDAAFAAALAGLPATATADEIRAALRSAAESELAAPPLSDTELDAVLATMTRGDDPQALTRATGGRDVVGLQLVMSAPPTSAPQTPVVLPVVVGFVVGAADAAPRDMLRAGVLARRAARAYPVSEPPKGSPARLFDRCLCWVLPATVFDDAGWPGGTSGNAAQKRAQRLAAARAWLAGQGIAVVVA